MSDNNTPPPPPDPWYLKMIKDQHFKLVLIYVLKTSGISSMAIVQKWFPGVSPDTEAVYIIAVLPFMLSFVIDWWRTNPNNLIKRGLMAFNGTKVSDDSKAAIVKAADKVSGVEIKVDPAVAPPAVTAMAQAPDNDVKMDKAA